MGDAKNDEGQNQGNKTQKLKDELKKVKKCGCCGGRTVKKCYTAIGVVLAIVVAVVSIGAIAWSIIAAVGTKVFSTAFSGRVVAYIVLAVTAAVALSAAIYVAVGLFKKNKKGLKIAGIVLFLLAVIQAIIAGVSVKVTFSDEYTLADSLRESFQLAAQGNPAHIKRWATTSSELQCCGLFGPEDYRRPNSAPLFPPDVPVYCCPSYNASQSAVAQEVTRQICKSTNLYYKNGCGKLVKVAVVATAELVLGVTIALIVLELLLSIHAHLTYIANKKLRAKEAENRDGEDGTPKPEHDHS